MWSQWLWVMVCSMTIHDSQPLTHHSTKWLTTAGSKLHTMTHNHWLHIAHHDSQPLAQHNKPWFKTTGSALNTMIPNHWAQHRTL
jgi:hypothetical protein